MTDLARRLPATGRRGDDDRVSRAGARGSDDLRGWDADDVPAEATLDRLGVDVRI